MRPREPAGKHFYGRRGEARPQYSAQDPAYEARGRALNVALRHRDRTIERAAGGDERRDAVRLLLRGAVGRRHDRSCIGGAMALLGHMGKFVREQRLSWSGVRLIAAGVEGDVRSRGIGDRPDRARRPRRGPVGVYAHAGEVVAEAQLELRSRAAVQGLAASAQGRGGLRGVFRNAPALALGPQMMQPPHGLRSGGDGQKACRLLLPYRSHDGHRGCSPSLLSTIEF